MHIVFLEQVLEPPVLLRHATAKSSLLSMAFFSQFIVQNLVFESEIWKTLTFFTYPDKQNHYFNIAFITFTSIVCLFIWGLEQIRNAHNMLNYRSTIF